MQRHIFPHKPLILFLPISASRWNKRWPHRTLVDENTLWTRHIGGRFAGWSAVWRELDGGFACELVGEETGWKRRHGLVYRVVASDDLGAVVFD